MKLGEKLPLRTTLWPILLTAVGYYVAGRLGLLQAIPPGYATAVWPASGLALAAVLLGGSRVWPGILLGSFFVNIATSFDSGGTAAILRSTLIASSIGTGAALQAVTGGWLIRRLVGYGNIFTQELGAIRMLVLGGPASCMINATIGVSTLWLAGLIPDPNYLFNWLTWWVGDSIGVLIFTPLILLWSLRPGRQWRRQQIVTTVPMAIMLAAVVTLFVYVSKREEARIQVEFEKWSDRFSYELEKDVGIYLKMLSAITGFFESSHEVSAEEFGHFGGRLLAGSSKVQALSWNPLVPNAERARFEAAQRERGIENYRIYAVAADGLPVHAYSKEQYFPVQYTVPFEANRLSLGYDISSEAVRQRALERALASGQASATGPIRLVQRKNQNIGLLIVEPVYSNSTGQRELQGYAVVAIDATSIVRSVAQLVVTTGLQVRIYDDTPPTAAVIYSSPGATADLVQAEGLHLSRKFDMNGRQWRLEFHVPAAYLVANRSWQAWMLLTGGLLFTGLLNLFLLQTVGHTARIEAVVKERTAELNSTNARLQTEIAERTQLQREASHKSLLLADKNRELERFAYVVSHDLQAPLRGVSGFAELLKQRYADKLGEEGREFLQFVTQGTVQMHSMIHDILELSRAGTREITLKTVDIGTVVERVCGLLRMDIEKAGARVQCGPLPTLEADEKQLLLLFQNLIGNAIKFCPADRTPEVNISTRQTAEGWHFEVKDNGIGIAPDKLDRLFNLFVRLHGTDEYPGTGLGLAICKRIVERHHGRIWVESEPGRGSSFNFTLSS
jgi:signal transduction histidine kinase/integral membrane sensor domain MASE1